MDLTDIRREYTKGGLRRDDLPKEPLVLFNKWLQQAVDAKLPDPTAMTIATVNADGQPFQRIVLLKDLDDDGFIFYTNLGSRKAEQLNINNKISLHFPWHILERQVHVTGYVEQLSTLEVMKYFSSRPKESQIAAWASKQSSRLSARQALEGKFFELKQKFSAGEVPLPSFWGGYRVKFDSIEFWQGGKHRLHDRFIYLRNDDNQWNIERLAP
ncbi:pyridoxamine 5'-phosphate oxidase [Photobacterium aquimaris]|uniref:Pyridoxine/pyridoxamine 5'-phosphate oxidase n=1 Tax=Photobacterium aquimaris TaxID=512643 RepID=A0A2T3IPG9_9GAMM|nr:pyridoxamine 5'-phosphate oxidase [Photobacterium aquimaris]OBU17019.1 pyridoxamine 5'-phosphate oxidase [Photobacterium aquimaris]OBU21877.1 pyridoxamine 5'-phosphate oxidase [Photobacterium aquimaris]PSU30236.1 pyridoxamine 5'-phosphate oxidase [Photobacterium aquimaris]PSV99428.1 pyridoxamine 5'-phosphate oxidase [Photobacterium aquimaris]